MKTSFFALKIIIRFAIIFKYIAKAVISTSILDSLKNKIKLTLYNYFNHLPEHNFPTS